MKVGDVFPSYEDLNKTLELYKKRVSNEYWIRDARTIDSQKKRHPDTVKNAKSELKYYYLVIACIRGGRKFKSKQENSTRKCSTSKQDCPAAIHVHMSKCQQYLTITKINQCHNHTTSLEYFNSLSQQRLKLPSAVKEDIREMLQAGANKKLVLDKVQARTGCNLTLKDLTNLNRRQDRKHFEECIEMLKNVYGCDVKLLINDEEVFQGLFFQDNRMKKYFEAFPEIIFIDGTYCLVDIRTAVYIIMVEDSNSQSEIVAVCLLSQENEESIDFFISSFKENNSFWEKVKVIMADKDKTERNVFQKHFPAAKLMICLFHVFQIFNREISTRKMDITPEEIQVSKKYLQKLTYSSSELEYTQTYEEMKKNVPAVVQAYYESNWANITDQWVKYLTFKNLCLSNSTNNRLECLNSKLKSVINRYSPLDDFIKHLFALINSQRIGNDTKSLQMLHKIPVKSPPEDSAEYFYMKQLTSFAFEKVKQQLDCPTKKFLPVENDSFIVTSSEGLLTVTPLTCECTFRTSSMLPCRHIFQCRRLLSLPLFDESLSLQRWTKSYYEGVISSEESNKTKEFEQQNTHSTNIKILNQDDTKPKRLTNHAKFKTMDEQCRILAQMCSEVSTPLFYERLKFIKNLIKEWSGNDNQDFEKNNSISCSVDSVMLGDSNKLIVENNTLRDCGRSTFGMKFTEESGDTMRNSESSTSGDICVVNSERLRDSETSTSGDICVVNSERLRDSETSTSGVTCVANSNSLRECEKKHSISSSSLEFGPENVSLKDIKMPPKLLKRGRPKGFGNTVIGLKRQSKGRKRKLQKPENDSKLNIVESEDYLEEEHLNDLEDFQEIEYVEQTKVDNYIDVEYLDEDIFE